MKTSFTRAALFALAFGLFSAMAQAATLQIYSVSSTVDPSQHNAAGNNVNPTFGTNWSTASTVNSGSEWVGATGYTSPANGTTLDFYHVFTVPGTPTTSAGSSTFKIMCADTCQVKINGTTVQAFDTAFTEYYGCGDTAGCRFNTMATLDISAYVTAGKNTIVITLKKSMQNSTQGAATNFGTVYYGSILYTPGTGCQ